MIQHVSTTPMASITEGMSDSAKINPPLCAYPPIPTKKLLSPDLSVYTEFTDERTVIKCFEPFRPLYRGKNPGKEKRIPKAKASIPFHPTLGNAAAPLTFSVLLP